MTIDRARELRAWANVLANNCEEYIADSSNMNRLSMNEAMRNLAMAMNNALDEDARSNVN